MRDSRVNPSVDYNYPIIYTFKNSNDRVVDYNYLIRFGYRNINDKVVEILLKDKELIFLLKIIMLLKDSRVNLSNNDNYNVDF